MKLTYLVLAAGVVSAASALALEESIRTMKPGHIIGGVSIDHDQD